MAGVDTACLLAVVPTGLGLPGVAYPMLAGVDTACLLAVVPTGLFSGLPILRINPLDFAAHQVTFHLHVAIVIDAA